MKAFMSRYSYESVHLLLNQIAIGLFGMVLALSAGLTDNDTLRIVTSVFSIIFFLFLHFVAMWKVGAQDRVSYDLGKLKKNYTIPVKMWLLANSLNFLLAFLMALGIWFDGVGALDGIAAVSTVIKLVIEGMYTGLLAIEVGGYPLNSYWFMHFLTTLPALAVVFTAYVLGFKNVTLARLFGSSSNTGSKK